MVSLTVDAHGDRETIDAAALVMCRERARGVRDEEHTEARQGREVLCTRDRNSGDHVLLESKPEPKETSGWFTYEPTEGIEPTTYRLQGDCSTVELRRRSPPIVSGRAVLANTAGASAGAAALDLELDLALDALKRVVNGLDVPVEQRSDFLVRLAVDVEAKHL